MPTVEGRKLMSPGLACVLLHIEAGLPLFAELQSVAKALMPRVAEICLVHRLTSCRLLPISRALVQGAVAAHDNILFQSPLHERRCRGVAPDHEVAKFVEKFAIGCIAQIIDVNLLQNLFLPIEVQVLLLLKDSIVLFQNCNFLPENGREIPVKT